MKDTVFAVSKTVHYLELLTAHFNKLSEEMLYDAFNK